MKTSFQKNNYLYDEHKLGTWKICRMRSKRAQTRTVMHLNRVLFKLHERNACIGHRVAWKIKIIIRNKCVLDSTSSSEFLTNKWPSYTDKVVWGRMSTVDDKSYLNLMLFCSVIIHTEIIRGICWIQTTLIVFYLLCFVSNRESITVDI